LKKVQKRETNKAAQRTRARLIAAAGAIFAKVGYQAATTRQICVKADANAAAVNYHFGDKLGLYTAVLKSFVRQNSVVRQKESGLAPDALLGMPAERALQEFILQMFENLAGKTTPDLYTRIMAHELSQPTPRLALVVDEIIRPRAQLLCLIVAKLSGSSPNARQTRINAHSVIAQIVHYAHAQPVIKLLWPDWRMDEDARHEIAAQITRFSLAALAADGRKRGRLSTKHEHRNP
jgi:AcrR family transcriptional regulator